MTLAHDVLLIALPAFIPAVVVISAVLYIAAKDRRDELAESEQASPETQNEEIRP